jgi:serine protease SohB
MQDIVFTYLLFLAQTITLALAIVFILGSIFSIAQRQKQQLKEGRMHVTHLNQKLKDQTQWVQSEILEPKVFKTLLKKIKTQENAKKRQKSAPQRHRLFVLSFTGDLMASSTPTLQTLINTLLPMLDTDLDRVLIKLESPGGVVHGYGFAASQLARIKAKGIPLIIAVDKVAASGGYMMACIADELIAAPFAIIGSIGVIGQLPNFHRLLEKNNIDYEQHTAGEYKRTLTVFGKNTPKAREKFQETLEITQDLFKQFIQEHRPKLADHMDEVATGEYWYGTQALEKKLVDTLSTSDDLILEAIQTQDVYELTYEVHKSLKEKWTQTAWSCLHRIGALFAQ